MLANFVIDSVVAALLMAGWYLWFRRANRRRSRQILRWIESAFDGHGAISGVRWQSASRFDVRLRLAVPVFRSASLAVQLEPREMPLNWLLGRLRKHKETVTFEAELDYRPRLKLHVQNHRWCAQTSRRRSSSLRGWQVEGLGVTVMSTQPEWQEVLGPMLEPLLATRSCDFLHVAFRTRAPHFVACAPLQSLRPTAPGSGMFEVLHELASNAPASMS